MIFLKDRQSGLSQAARLLGWRVAGVFIVAMGLLALSILGWQTRAAHAAEVSCAQPLPTVEYLGEDFSQYTLPDGFETFIVKRVKPFRFVQEAGEDQQGERVYTAQPGDQRAWACRGNCDLPAAYGEEVSLGQLDEGTRIELVVIDDDGFEQDQDERRNWFAANDPLQPYQIVEEQNMAETLTFDVPFTAEWYFYAKDSIGIVDSCIVPPTAVPSETPVATSTPLPTETLVAPETPVAPATPTPAASATATATATASATPPATPPATPSATTTVLPVSTSVASPTAAPSATASPTATATAILPSVATETPTVAPPTVAPPTVAPPTVAPPTATPSPTDGPRLNKPPVPTALTLSAFQAVARPDGIALIWETALEVETQGFYLWRSEGDAQAGNGRDGAVQITPSLLLAQGSTTTGAGYRFHDASAERGKTYTYWLQEISNSDVQDVASLSVQMPAAWLYLPVVQQ